MNLTSIDRIDFLCQQAAALDPPAEQRQQLWRAVGAYAERFMQSIGEAPAFRIDEGNDDTEVFDVAEAPANISELLETIEEHIDRTGINPTSGRFMGYIPGGGIFPAALGDYLAAVANRYAGYSFAAPGAVRLENALLAWMAQVVGFPPAARGNLTSGGSLAHLIALVVARDAKEITPDRISQSVIYTSDQIHHCLQKAIHICGLGTCPLRQIPTDRQFRLDPGQLQRAVLKDQADGLTPWLVMASAGTVNSGAIDPLEAIGRLARDHELWYHVDGAYGAFFALCDAGRERLRGMGEADSIVMDPHKTLFLPYGTGAVLIKDGQRLAHSFKSNPDYFQDGEAHQLDLSPADVSPELTKHFRGLRVWLPLKLFGLGPFRAALEEKMLLASYFHERIQRVPGFRVGPPPDLAVATFWFQPTAGDADDFNRRLMQCIQEDGRVFISSTQLNGRFVLRAAIGVFRTHREALDLLVEVLREKSQEIYRSSSS